MFSNCALHCLDPIAGPFEKPFTSKCHGSVCCFVTANPIIFQWVCSEISPYKKSRTVLLGIALLFLWRTASTKFFHIFSFLTPWPSLSSKNKFSPNVFIVPCRWLLWKDQTLLGRNSLRLSCAQKLHIGKWLVDPGFNYTCKITYTGINISTLVEM